MTGKILGSHRRFEPPDSPHGNFVVAERFHVDKPDFAGQHVIDAARRAVEIGMRREDRHVVFNQTRQLFAERQVEADILYRAENQRMMRDD